MMLCSTSQFNDFPMHCTSMHFISYHLDKEVTYIFNLFLFSISFICQQRPRSLALHLTHRLLLVVRFSPWHVAVPLTYHWCGDRKTCPQELLRPRPRVSGHIWNRRRFFADSASVHTSGDMSPANESAKTSIHSPKWNVWMRHESDIVWKPNLVESRGGNAIYGPYRYVPLWRVWFSSSLL